ncbi:MAG: hypothetical protein HS104_23060 [Polyangiaceae bacterium]|nr:hypothetical protein [Polyangiaceae bacterium]MCL4754945.1 hypothetical protein [Myxococcales bacterium]
MTQPNQKKDPTADDSVESRRRSGTRRIDASEPVSVPRAPRVPSIGWPDSVDQDHVPTQPENEVPSSSSSMPTLAAPPPQSRATVEMPDDDESRDTIPSPGPAAES